MKKKALSLALVCLHVISFDTAALAQDRSTSDLDQLIEESRSAAQAQTLQQIAKNNQLVEEINQLTLQIDQLESDISTNKKDVKRNLIIAGGTIIATLLANTKLNKSVKNESADQMRILMGILATYIGGAITLVSTGGSGLNYVLVHIDQNKVVLLQKKLNSLKQELLAENQALQM